MGSGTGSPRADCGIADCCTLVRFIFLVCCLTRLLGYFAVSRRTIITAGGDYQSHSLGGADTRHSHQEAALLVLRVLEIRIACVRPFGP